jgi:hypothetical protein
MHSGRIFQTVLEFALACGFCLLAVLLLPLAFWRYLDGSLLAVAIAVVVTGGVWLRHARAPQPEKASRARLPGSAE